MRHVSRRRTPGIIPAPLGESRDFRRSTEMVLSDSHSDTEGDPFSHDCLSALLCLHNEERAGSWKECGKGDSRPGGGCVCGGVLLFAWAVRVLTLTFPINEPLEGTGTGDAEQQEGRGGCGERGEKKAARIRQRERGAILCKPCHFCRYCRLFNQ